jgi:predicted transcriptional regulator
VNKNLILDGKWEQDCNIFANKSSLILEWILSKGCKQESFSVREVAREANISMGLVQRVFKKLVWIGVISESGIRTAKVFSLKKPKLLLDKWIEWYSISKKAKLWSYSSVFQDKSELMNLLEDSLFSNQVMLALHSAAGSYGVKNTNLQTLELYLLNPSIREGIEKLLELEPKEKGYQVLIIQPYYKSFLRNQMDKLLVNRNSDELLYSPELLTFLDLYNFPLRGREQAEYVASRFEIIKSVYGEGL